MGFSVNDILIKTPIGVQYASNPKAFPSIEISTSLRRLLIIIDGRQPISSLLNKGLTNIDMNSFEQLAYQGLIVQKTIHTAAEIQTTSVALGIKKGKSFSATRFDILDALLTHTMKDTNAKQWVDSFEKAQSLDELNIIFSHFKDSTVCKKNPTILVNLNNILGRS